jgi:hypothetical protein
MKGNSRRDQVNDIQAIDEEGNVQIWQLYKSNAGLWTLRDAQGLEIEFETTLNESKPAMKRCLQNRGLKAKI